MGDADRMHGYKFGCEGLTTVPEACEKLGVSRDTLDRLIHRGVLRKGKDPITGRVSICRKSVDVYIAGIEV